MAIKLHQNDPLSNELVLSPENGAGANTESRINLYIQWMNQNEQHWTSPSLAAYRDHLLYIEEKKASTVTSYLASIRAQYQRILRDNNLRELMIQHAPGDDFANKRAFVDELCTRIANDIHPAEAKVKTKTVQDATDSAHLRLTPSQAMSLINAPGTYSLRGLRDTVAIALMLTTGVRVSELCAIRVEHLRERYHGQLALLVPDGKGSKQRMIPYGSFDWVLVLVDHWLLRAGIDNGYVLRGFWRGYSSVRPTPLTTRAIDMMLECHPVLIDGSMRVVNAHDHRRSYSRMLYDSGMAPEVIQQNLGHSNIQTTMGYIGDLNPELRKPPAGILNFNVGSLIR